MRPDSSFNVGWTQEWTSLKRLRKNKCINVREVVRGPFSSPRLLKTRPFVAFSSCQRQEKNYFDLPRGIPDTWREYLISKGFCTTSEAYVLQKNLIPSCIRYFATERLWNDTSLSFIQGIPDPWKSRSFDRRQPAKCSRPRFPRAKNVRSMRTTYTYDGDDEAEIERSERCQFNKDRIDDKKDPTQEGHGESNYPLIEETFKDNFEAKKTAERHSSRFPFDKESQISSRSKRRENTKHDQYTEIDLGKARKITSNKHIKKDRLKDEKQLIPKNNKTITKKIFKDLKNKTITKMGVQTVPINVADGATQTGIPLKDKTVQEEGSFSKKHVEINTKPYADDTVCCNCILRGYILSSMHCFSNFTNLWKDIDLSNRVLCQECENSYCKRKSEKLITSTKKLEFCTPDPKKCSKRVYTTQKEIYKRTKQKLRVCVQKARKRLAARDRPDRCVQTKDAIVSKQELKLMCYHCNSPYLKIASISANTSGRNTYSCICRTAASKLKTVQHKIRDHVTKRSITKRGKNCSYTCSESKRYVSKCDLDCTSPSVVIKWRNNVVEKNNSGFLKENDHDNTMHGNVVTDVTTNIKEMLKDASSNQLFTDDIKKERCENEPLGDDSCNVVNKNKEMDKQTNTVINENEEIEVAQFQYSKSDKTLWYSVSDSGECADLSDNIADAGFNVTTQDRLSVTSITSTQQLDNAISTKRHYQKKKSRKPCHARYKSAGGITSDFKQSLEFGSNFPVTSYNDVPCSSTDKKSKIHEELIGIRKKKGKY